MLLTGLSGGKPLLPADLEFVRSILAGTPEGQANFLALAEEEGVAGLVYSRLKAAGLNAEEPLLGGLKRSYLKQAARNMLAFREIEEFMSAVREKGLRLAVTKGARLALTVYDDPGLRPFWDIDLFVHPADWSAAASLLDRNGFRLVSGFGRAKGPVDGRPWTFSPYYRKDRIHLEFHSQPLGLAVPLRGGRDFWRTMDETDLGRTKIGILSPGFELCYLCLHAAQHSYSRLIWLADLAAVLEKEVSAQDEAEAIAADEGLTGVVRKSLALAGDVMGARVDERSLARLHPGYPVRKFLDFLWPVEDVAARRKSEPWPYEITSLVCLWERRDIGQVARVLPGLLFPPPAWVAYVSGEERPGRLSLRRYFSRLASPLVRAVRRVMRLP